jgi:hypothetical protein
LSRHCLVKNAKEKCLLNDMGIDGHVLYKMYVCEEFCMLFDVVICKIGSDILPYPFGGLYVFVCCTNDFCQITVVNI